MIKTPVHNLEGQVKGEIELQGEVFGLPPNPAVVHQAVVRHLANCRLGTVSVRTRGEVEGSGRKLFAQKHTGRARAGSRRAPQRRGSGKAFGPKPRDYHQRMPKKMRRLAIKCALSDKLREGEMVVIGDLNNLQPKTREMEQLLGRLGVGGSALVVTEKAEPAVVTAARNLPGIKTLPAPLLNTYDILKYEKLVITVEAVRQAEALWGRK